MGGVIDSIGGGFEDFANGIGDIGGDVVGGIGDGFKEFGKFMTKPEVIGPLALAGATAATVLTGGAAAPAMAPAAGLASGLGTGAGVAAGAIPGLLGGAPLVGGEIAATAAGAGAAGAGAAGALPAAGESIAMLGPAGFESIGGIGNIAEPSLLSKLFSDMTVGQGLKLGGQALSAANMGSDMANKLDPPTQAMPSDDPVAQLLNQQPLGQPVQYDQNYMMPYK